MAEEIPSSGNTEHEESAVLHVHSEPHKAHEHSITSNFNLRDISMYKKHIFAFAMYLVFAMVMFYPIVLHIATYAPGTGADTYQNLWDIWWVKYSVFNTHSNVFYTHLLFWPIGANLVYGTLAPLTGLISVPFQLLGTVFAYNIMFLLGFALSGLTMYILANYLTKNNYAALISGFIFTFSAFHIAQSYSHIHFMNIEWIPLVIYFFIKIVHEKRSYANIIGMAASFALTTLMGNIEQTLMLFFALVLLFVIYLIYKETRKKLLTLNFGISMVLFVVLAFLIGSWNFIPLINAVTRAGGLGLVNSLNTAASNIEWSINPISFFVPSYYNGIIYFSGVPSNIYNTLYAPDPVEKVGYIGYVVLALVLYGIYKYRKEMLPWVVCAVVFAWISLGPSFGLYTIYHALPALNVVREPGRFYLIATVFIAIIASYGAKAVFEQFTPHHGSQKSHRNKAYIILIALLILMFIENNGTPLANPSQVVTNVKVPLLYYQLANITGNFSILEIPTLPTSTPAPYLYPGMDTFYTSITHKPLVGGYTGRENLTSSILLFNLPLAVQASYLISNGTGYYPSPVIENYTNQTLLTLYNYNTEFIVLHKDAFTQQELTPIEDYLLSTFGYRTPNGNLTPVYNDNTSTAFQTLAAINKSVFRSFVTYPILADWSSISVFLNGSQQIFWVPSGAGAMVVYAPYSSSINTSTFRNPNLPSYINTRISFVAASNIPQKLYIAELTNTNSTRTIAAFNITNRPTKYTTNTPLISGPTGNLVYFLYQSGNANTPVLLQNITITR